MASSEPSPRLPPIFLSHAGEQKGFVWNLYRELKCVNHNPFFDQDTSKSLPKATPFPSRILEACCACKLGIVVLSHEYIESLWPMLELQQFIFHKIPLLPLFYKLKPADLSKPENLARWRGVWEKNEASWNQKVQQMHMAADSGMSIMSGSSSDSPRATLWLEALEKLRHQSGHILPENKDEDAYVQAIVSDVRKILPPPLRTYLSLGGHYQGAKHIQETIHGLFRQQQSIRCDADPSGPPTGLPISVGLYGMGGSGNTTVCKYMLNFYDREFSGCCCFLPLSSTENEGQLQLLQHLEEIMSQLGYGMSNKLTAVEPAMLHLQKALRRRNRPVFLVIDNVWEWALLQAKEILAMDYVRGSRLLVTARSRGLLEKLRSSVMNEYNDGRGQLAMEICHVPSISEEEALEALKVYSFFPSRPGSNANGEDQLSRLAKSCFFGAQCHPLLLKAVGGKVSKILGGSPVAVQVKSLESLVSRLQVRRIGGDGDSIEEEIVKALRTSYDALDSNLRRFLLMLGTCVPREYFEKQCLSKAVEWLSMIWDQSIEDVRTQMNALEYHGLIQVINDESTVVIHELQRVMIEKIVKEDVNGAPGCDFFEGDATTLRNSNWRSLKYIYGYGKHGDSTKMEVFSYTWATKKGVFHGAHLPVEVLRLSNMSPNTRSGSFFLCRVEHLRYLELHMVEGVEQVGGWEHAPNLVSVVISNCEALHEIDPITGHLSRLTNLTFVHLGKWCKNSSAMLSTLSVPHCAGALQRCILHSNPLISTFPSLTGLSNLRELNLSHCEKLKSIEGDECSLTALEELSLAGCVSLKSIPDLKQLAKLRSLKLEGCVALHEVKVGEATVRNLEYLSIQYGRTHFSTGSSPAEVKCISAFTNLRALHARGDSGSRSRLAGSFSSSSSARRKHVDMIRSMRLPASLEELSLGGFAGAPELPDNLSALANLKRLELDQGWSSSADNGTERSALEAVRTKLGSLKLHALEHWSFT